jgi:hypothetical protein
MNSDTKSTTELAEHLIRVEFERLKKERKERSEINQSSKKRKERE